MNPVYNGNWPDVVIERTQFRDNLEQSVDRLPIFSQAEIERIKGTSDFLGVNYYLTNLISNREESSDRVLSYDNDVRANVEVDPNWIIGYNNYPVSIALTSVGYLRISFKEN